MEEKDQIKSNEAASEVRKEPVKLCNICGELRNNPKEKKNPGRKKSNGKEETDKKKWGPEAFKSWTSSRPVVVLENKTGNKDAGWA